MSFARSAVKTLVNYQILYSNNFYSQDMGHRREKRFNIRARLFIGSLPNDVDEEWLRELFKPHSEVSEVFLHKEKGFGFVRCVSGEFKSSKM